MTVNLHDWIDELCDALDVSLDVDEALILDVTRDAAHAVQRTAGPITAFLVGYALAGSDGDPDELERLAATASELAARWDKSPDDEDDDEDEPVEDIDLSGEEDDQDEEN